MAYREETGNLSINLNYWGSGQVRGGGDEQDEGEGDEGCEGVGAWERGVVSRKS